MSVTLPFDEQTPLKYLGLPLDYEPSPRTATISFLTKHLTQLPPHILLHFSYITNPKQRANIPAIRNRRLAYTQRHPSELSVTIGRSRWPQLWEGRENRDNEEANEERQWAASSFLDGSTKHIGKLGKLLGEYEEEREAERMRALRRERAANNFVPEEESDSEDDGESHHPISVETENEEEQKILFERLIQSRFIYGLLEGINYDTVDWDESLDADDDREIQDRWFDAEDDD